jgi:hypothetical protein
MWDFPVILTRGGPKLKRKRYLDEKINPILQEHEAGAEFNHSEPAD